MGVLLRGLGWLLLVLLILAIAALAVLRLSPNLLWPFAEDAAADAGFALSQSGLAVELFPLAVAIDELAVTEVGQGEPVFQADRLEADVDLGAWLGDSAWLALVLGDATVRPFALAATEPPAPAEPVTPESVRSLDLSPLEALSSVSLQSLRLILEPGAEASVTVNSQLGREAGDLVLSLEGEAAGLALDLSGTFVPSPKPTLKLSAERLDLSSLFDVAADPATDEPASANAALTFDASALAGGKLVAALEAVGEEALALQLVVTLSMVEIDLSVAELIGVRAQIPVSDDDALPLALSVDLEGGLNRVALSNLDATWGPNDLTGTLALGVAPFNATGELRSTALSLPVSRERPRESADAPEQDPERQEAETLLFSETPFDLAWLRDGSVDVRLDVDRLAVLEADFSAVTAKLRASDGELKLSDVAGTFGDGGFSIDGSLRAIDGVASADEQAESAGDAQAVDQAQAQLAIEVSGVNLEAFGFVPQEELTGGQLTAAIELAGSGASQTELAGALAGEVLVTVTDAVVQNDTFELVGSDLLMETLNKLNPFVRSDPTTELDCALVDLTVEEGVFRSSNSLVVETEKMVIVGDGTITLPSGQLDIGFTPSARAGIGVNVGSLVKFLKIGGTIRAPRPAADAVGLLKSGAAVGAALSTGGVSVLAEGLLKRVANAGSACERALSEKDNPPGADTAKPAGAAPDGSDQQPVD